MIADRYYYQKLSDKEKTVYKELYQGVLNHENEVLLSVDDITNEEMKRVFNAVSDDNPLLYYFNQTELEGARTERGLVFRPRYFYDSNQVKAYNIRIQNEVNSIMNCLNFSTASELEKEKRIHDYMCKNVSYDFDALKTRTIEAYNILGVFLDGKAVCEGISKATKLLLNTANVKCIIVSGHVESSNMGISGGHAWNLVNIDGVPTHLDMTFDLGNSEEHRICYDYFNLTDAEISSDHHDFFGIPKCNDGKYNYLRMQRAIFRSKLDPENYVLNGAANGKRDFYFKLEQCRNPEDVVASLVQPALRVAFNADGQKWQCRHYVNESLGIGRMTLHM